MQARGTPFVQRLVAEHIRHFVANAIQSGATVSTAEVIDEIRVLYPGAGIAKRALADEILMAAAAAGLAVEIGRAKRSDTLGRQGVPSEAL